MRNFDYRNNQNNRNSQNNNNRNNKSGKAPSFGSPYNFVPLNESILIPWWNDLVSQDCPLVDAESGSLTLEITNLTPMFVRDGDGKKHSVRNAEGKVIEYDYSAHIATPEGKRYFIPGSSLRGMLRSVAEILSFSQMKSYNKDYFGYRDFGGNQSTNALSYKNEMEDVKCGWLRMEDEVLILDPCAGFEKIDLRLDPKFLNIFGNRTLNAQEKHDLIEKNFGNRYPMVAGGNVVCTGDFRGKKHDYIFKPRTGEVLHLSDNIKDKFISIYKPSPYFDFLIKTLRKGDKVPVFYTDDEAGRVKNIGLTRNFRLPYKYSVKGCINQDLLDDNAYTEDASGNSIKGHDMADLLFGYVDNDQALKGRVWIGSAFAQSVIADDKLIPMMGVLGEPSASFYPRYLKQEDDNDHFNSYDGKKGIPEIAGRKRYRVHAQSYITKLPTGNGNQKVMSKFMRLPSNTTFKLTISFHNLLPEEIGLLLSAITFHGTDGVSHNIGMAKSYGYGKLGIKIAEVSGLSHSQKYYLEFFERFINNFTLSDEATELPWVDTPQIKTLMAIASDHSSGLEMMELEDYKAAKKKENKSQVVLNEKGIRLHVNSYLPDAGSVDLIESPGVKLHNAIKSKITNK